MAPTPLTELEVENARLRAELEALRTAHAQLVATVAASRMVEERLERTLDSITDGYYALDAEGRFLDANRIAERHFGKSVDELRRITFWDLIGDQAAAALRARVALAIEAGQPVDFEYASQLQPGVWVEAHVYPREGGVGEVYYRDISERKRVEQALLEADRRKNQFLATLSHELRNPLAPIRSSLFILDRAAPGSEQARRAQAIIERQTRQLARLVDDLLDVTRITRNMIQLQRQRLELNELVRTTTEDHRSLFDQNDVALELAVAPAAVYVNADWNRLAQVVGNLLHNAAKFTGRKGVTRVSVTADAASRQAVITVEDTGVGMTREMQGRLFEPFSQADESLERSKGGLGLGLALVKGLIDLHGGTISAHSGGLGTGSEFVVRLPLDVPVQEQPAATQSGADPKRRRVLVIEDNLDAADSLREALELDEHTIEVANDGREGVEKARVFHPDVVLCDIGLPGMDGYEVARAFRADEALKGVFLIALSGYAMPEDLERARSAGFDRHVAKPPSLERLEEMIAQAPGR